MIRYSLPAMKGGRPFVVLAGMDCLQGLQAARIFTRHDVPVVGIAAERGHFCCRTRVCHDIRFADTRSEELIASLEAMGPEFAEKPVLLPCQDESVLLVSRHRERLQPWYHFRLPQHDIVEMALDKAKFYRFARNQGFEVPASYLVWDNNDLEQACLHLTFPCLIKPRARSATWKDNCAFKAFKVGSPQELQQRYEICRQWSDGLLVQEWIPGKDANLYSCNGYFDADGMPLVTFVARKIRQWPPEVGESSLGEECRNDKVLKETIRVFQSMQLSGLGYLEFKHCTETGRYVIIEPNIGRPTGRSAIAEGGGVELLYTFYCDVLGWPLPEARTQHYTQVKWIHLVRDTASALHYLRKGELTLREWLQSLQGRKVYAVLSMDDLGPFWGDMKRAVQWWFSPVERYRRRAGFRIRPKDLQVKSGRRQHTSIAGP